MFKLERHAHAKAMPYSQAVSKQLHSYSHNSAMSLRLWHLPHALPTLLHNIPTPCPTLTYPALFMPSIASHSCLLFFPCPVTNLALPCVRLYALPNALHSPLCPTLHLVQGRRCPVPYLVP